MTEAIRLITYPALRHKLWPIIGEWPWARDALWDLWKLGAPLPQDKCPEQEFGGKPCPSYPLCNHIRRILLPGMFAKWWKEVADRQAIDISAAHMLEALGSETH